MPRRPNHLDTLLMTLEMLKRIPRGRKISAPELRDQLEEAGYARDLRTIQRQLDILSQHFDIERDDRGKPYGYSWKSHGGGLSLTTLNEQESVLLTLAEQHLRHLLPARLMKSMEGFFEQARLQLRAQPHARRNADWLDKVRLVETTQRLLPPVLRDGVFEAVSNALYADHWLDVDYQNVKGERAKWRVMPLGLAQQGARLLLVCRFEGYDDNRLLALNRLHGATDTHLPFSRPKDFNLRRFDEEEGGFSFSKGETIELVFRLPKEIGLFITESRLSPNQQVREIGDRYEFQATVIKSGQLRWWLRGFGPALELVSPADLLDEPAK